MVPGMPPIVCSRKSICEISSRLIMASQLSSRLVVGCGGFIRREHNVVARDAHSIAKLQLSCRRTVASAPVIAQDIDKETVRRGLYRKVFLEAWVPRELRRAPPPCFDECPPRHRDGTAWVMLDNLIELEPSKRRVACSCASPFKTCAWPGEKRAPSRAA